MYFLTYKSSRKKGNNNYNNNKRRKYFQCIELERLRRIIEMELLIHSPEIHPQNMF